MKSFTAASVVLALSSTTLAWDPDCNWQNCLASWDAGQCGSTSRMDCLCGNGTAIDEVNSCVVASCDSWKDQEAVYAAVDQLCADEGHTVTNTPEATFSMTSGSNAIPTVNGHSWDWDTVQWDDWLVSASNVIAGSAGGPAPAGVSCQPITGWSAAWGPWSAAWTWTECSGTSPLPTTMTMTMTSNGVVTVTTTSTTLYVAPQTTTATAGATSSGAVTTAATAGATTGAAVAAQSATASASSTSSANAAAAAPTQNVHVAAMGGAAVAVFGLMVAL